VIDDIPFVFTHADTRALVEDRYRVMQESLDWADRWADRQVDRRV
jgi:hypothetical protein